MYVTFPHRFRPLAQSFAVMALACLAPDLAHAAGAAGDPPPAPDWGGFHIGGSVDAGLGASSSRSHLLANGKLDDGELAPSSGSQAGFGYLIGPSVGYRWQIGKVVLGTDADISIGQVGHGSNQSGSVEGGIGFNSSQNSTLNFLSTIRGSLGYSPVDRLLVYATGGVAAGQTTNTTSLMFPQTRYDASRVVLAPGWVAGGGLDYAFDRRLSVQLQFLHADLGTTSAVGLRDFPSYYHTQTNFALRDNVLALGIDYRFGAGAGAGAGGDGATSPLHLPPLLRNSSYEIGTRYWYSTGSIRYKLGTTGSNDLVSKLTYSDVVSNAGEIFGRVDHPLGLFLKGYAGLGTGAGGSLKDEDFPPFITPYSATHSSQQGGGIQYGALDLGYDAVVRPRLRVGPFVGYGYFGEQANADGCTQLAGNSAICGSGSISPTTLGISEAASWNVARLGVAGDATLIDGVRLDAEAAWVPFGALSGTDTHWIRLDTPGDFSAPIGQSGTVHGVQIEASLHYRITPAIDLAAGGRFWRFDARGKMTAHFSDGSVAEPSKFSTERYGPFVQAGVAF